MSVHLPVAPGLASDNSTTRHLRAGLYYAAFSRLARGRKHIPVVCRSSDAHAALAISEQGKVRHVR